jgi:hypothetical protein
MPWTTVDVEINLDDFTTEDLVRELELRDALPSRRLPDTVIEQLDHIHRARLCGQPWEDDLDRFLKDTLGRAI